MLYYEHTRTRSHIYETHTPQTNMNVECESLRHTVTEFTNVTHLIASDGVKVCCRSVLQLAKRNDVISKYSVCGCLRSLKASPPPSIPGPVIPDFCTLEERGRLTGWCRRRWRNTVRIHTHILNISGLKSSHYCYYYYTICMSPVTDISSWYFS